MFVEKERRTAYLTVRLTPREHAVVRTEAERRGITIGGYVRSAIGRVVALSDGETEIEHERIHAP